MTRSTKIASPKDRKYLESLNLKALQKSRPKGDQDPKEYYRSLQEEAKSGPLFNDKVLDTVEHLPDLPKPVSKWLGNMDDKELKQVDSQDLRLIIDWVQGSEDADLDGLSWDDAMEAQQNWHDQLHNSKEDCGEYQTHKVVFSTGGYEFVDLTTDRDLKVEGCKLKHCVGGDNYCDAVKNKNSRIISMRNSENEPLITIQYLVNDKTVNQCYGYKNHPPARKLNEPLVKFFEHMKWYDGIFLLKNYTIPEAKLEVLLDSSGDDSRIKIAMRTTNRAVLSKLSEDPSYRIRGCVANNPNTAADTLTYLAADQNASVRTNVAMNSNTPADTLNALVFDTDRYVVHAVAGREELSELSLVALSQSEDENIRTQVAYHRTTPTMILEKLAKDADMFVRLNVARNPKTPYAILDVLSDDKNQVVAREAKYQRGLKKSAAIMKSAQTLRGIL